MEALDLFVTFMHLSADGGARPVPWTQDFWRTLRAAVGDRVVGAKRGVTPGDFHPGEWEMHPAGDELLHLLTGAIEVVLDEPGGERVVALHAGQTCIVPRGVWHRLMLRQPSDLLFVTPPHGTQLRPVGA
jgi:mannose-6-phosphate isomerase-like protein (cupin superfamily)